MQVGTHQNRLGALIHFEQEWGKVTPYLKNLFNYGQLSYFYSFKDLGIDKKSHNLFSAIGVGVSFGQKADKKGLPFVHGNYRHNIIYQFEYYHNDIKTSQQSGLIGYAYLNPKFAVKFFIENDFFSPKHWDAFRTAAFNLSVHFGKYPNNWGVGVGWAAWTGKTPVPRPSGTNRDSVFDLSTLFAGEFSHGILEISFYYRYFGISVGWDSEAIRDRVQNSFHYMINDGKIPRVDRDDRFYFQVSFNPMHMLY